MDGSSRKLIYLIRHAQALHNVEDDFTIPDPPLTETGVDQAKQIKSLLPHIFEHTRCPQLICTSPLRRTLQTTLHGFDTLLDKEHKTPLLIHPDLQECSKYKCDTGSCRDTMEREYPDLDFSLLADDWNRKEGRYSPDEESLDSRAQDVRRMLRERPEHVILVVSHGAFLRHLTQTPWTDRWANAEGRSFTIDDSDEAKLILLANQAPELSGFDKPANDE